jgi:head-tail adaptor
MKPLIRRIWFAAILTAVAQWNVISSAQYFGGAIEQHTTLTIKSDGSSVLLQESVQPRAMVEQQVRSWERYQKMSDAAEQSEGQPNSEAKTEAAAKPFSDEELTQKFQEMMKGRSDESGAESDESVRLEVQKDSVRMRSSRSFASLEEMLREGNSIWWQEAVSFENARFEKDTNNLLRVTLTPQSEMQRYFKTLRSTLKLRGMTSELKLVFPGKVITSGFPETQTNATWLTTDSKNDATLDFVAKLYDGPVIITAEVGGLKLDQPLESKKLARTRGGRHEAGNDLPVTEAGPGFLAEPLTITTTTLHVFPDGENYFKNASTAYEHRTGTVVNAKLFAPKGRTLQSVSEVRVLKVTDDKGRAISSESESAEFTESETYSGDSQRRDSTHIALRFQLPQPDASAIDEISAEAIAVTAGVWKEMTLTNIQANATNELNLADVLSGAKLVITKSAFKQNQLNVQMQIKGPPTIQRLDIQAKIPGSDGFNSSLSERKFTARNNTSTRSVEIRGYDTGGNISDARHIVLIIRYPQDLKRERVNFKLKGLDLL